MPLAKAMAPHLPPIGKFNSFYFVESFIYQRNPAPPAKELMAKYPY
jgi:hypothetical protein